MERRYMRIFTKIRAVVLGFIMLASVIGGMQSASADHGVVTSHWNRYTWGGQTFASTGNARYVNILDRSGVSAIAGSLQEFAQSWNNNMIAKGWQNWAPLFVYYQDWANVGQCPLSAWHLPGNSFVTVCADNSGGGVTYQVTSGHSNDYQPSVFVSRNLDYVTTFSVAAHEMGHAMGLNHSGDQANLMYPTVTSGVKKWFSAHDFQVVGDFYSAHPVH